MVGGRIVTFVLKYNSKQNDVIRAISSQDIEQCHDDVVVSRHDVPVRVTMTALFFSKSLTPRTLDSKQTQCNSCKQSRRYVF